MTYRTGVGTIGGRPMSWARMKLPLCSPVDGSIPPAECLTVQVAQAIAQEFCVAVDVETQRLSYIFNEIEAHRQSFQLLPPTALYDECVAASASALETYQLFESDAQRLAKLGLPELKARVAAQVADASKTLKIVQTMAANGVTATDAQSKIQRKSQTEIEKIEQKTRDHLVDSQIKNDGLWSGYFRRG